MQLVFIAPSFFPSTYYGGPIYSTYELATALKKTGVDVRVITTNANGNEKLKIKTGTFHKLENELPVKYYKSLDSRGTSLSMILNLKKEIKEADIVYLISIFSPPTPFVIRLCKTLNKPLIISPRGQLGKWCLEQGSPFKKLWLRLFISSRRNPIHRVKTEQPFNHPEPFDELRAGSVEGQSINPLFYWHLTSEKEQQSVLAVYPTANTFVIPNGVNEEMFSLNDKPKDRTFYNKYTGFDCTDKKIVISMGRLQRVKGFDILIEAIGMIEKQNVVLLIAGEDFGEMNKLDWMIEKSGLKEKVFLIGMIEGKEKIEFLRNADVFALPSHHENFGIVYGEALAAGTPIVASKNTPWQDVEKHKCGKWVENTPEKFAEAIIDILNSDIEQMGNNGSKFIKENFSLDNIASDFLRQADKMTGKMVNAW